MGHPAPQTDTTAASVGRHVAAALDVAGISRLDASRQTGIPRETFYRKCRGGSPFDVDELGRIAALLGCSVADLVEGKVRAA